MPAEAWKLVGDRGVQALTALFNRITGDDEAPLIWLTSTTVPIWKNKGDAADCANYHPIRLVCHTMKVFERASSTS